MRASGPVPVERTSDITSLRFSGVKMSTLGSVPGVVARHPLRAPVPYRRGEGAALTSPSRRTLTPVKSVRTFVDARHAAFCVYCFGMPDTRDHVPPRVFLDRPFPENLPIVGSCRACNAGASLDEEYVACALELLACGSARSDDWERDGIVRSLARNPRLTRRLTEAFDETEGVLAVEGERFARVARKIGCALWSYETGEPSGDCVGAVGFATLGSLSSLTWQRFTSVPAPSIMPEVGSRMMVVALETPRGVYAEGWRDVQPGRFSYAVRLSDGPRVRMVLREVLAAEVMFDSA